MRTFLILCGIVWVGLSVGVPMLRSWNLPGTNVVSAHAQAADFE